MFVKFFIKIIIFSVTVSIFYAPDESWARPVSYPGGWTLMSMNSPEVNSIHIHYSPTAKYSIGYLAQYWREDKYQTHSVQLNNLLKRWNNIDSQANAYLKSGLGFAYEGSGDISDSVQPHAFSGISLDWENRRFFTQYENSFHYSGDFNKEYMQSIKLGIAPYIGEYGDLHTWFMFKIDHNPEDNDKFTATPLVRFFKDVYLLEVGYSEKKEVMVNVVVRF